MGYRKIRHHGGLDGKKLPGIGNKSEWQEFTRHNIHAKLYKPDTPKISTPTQPKTNKITLQVKSTQLWRKNKMCRPWRHQKNLQPSDTTHVLQVIFTLLYYSIEVYNNSCFTKRTDIHTIKNKKIRRRNQYYTSSITHQLTKTRRYDTTRAEWYYISTGMDCICLHPKNVAALDETYS